MYPNEALGGSLEELQAVRELKCLCFFPSLCVCWMLIKDRALDENAPSCPLGTSNLVIRRAHFCGQSFRASQKCWILFLFLLRYTGWDASSGIFKVLVASLGCIHISLFTLSWRLKRSHFFFKHLKSLLNKGWFWVFIDPLVAAAILLFLGLSLSFQTSLWLTRKEADRGFGQLVSLLWN